MPESEPLSPEECLATLMSGGPAGATGLSEVAVQRREQIMDAAEGIIAGRGIHRMSLAAIEQRAGMSRGQLTYYFATKEAILLAVFERMLYRIIAQDLKSAGPKPLTGQAWECLRHGLSQHLKPEPHPGEKELFSLLHTFLAQMAHREDYRDRLSKLYRDWRGFIAADVAGSVPEPRPVPPEIVASLLQATLHGLGMLLAVDPQAFDRTQMQAACLRLFAPLFKHTDPDPAPKGGAS